MEEKKPDENAENYSSNIPESEPETSNLVEQSIPEDEPENTKAEQTTDLPDNTKHDSITWSALEFVEREKPAGWYIVLAFVILLISVGVYFVTRHSIFAPIMIIIVGFIFGFFARRHPRTLKYTIDDRGITLSNRTISYNELKSFSIVDEEKLGAIVFNPLKRFSFPTTIHYDIEDEEKITGVVSEYLPLEEAPKDSVDQLMRRLHF
jgi:hypothetical protein